MMSNDPESTNILGAKRRRREGRGYALERRGGDMGWETGGNTDVCKHIARTSRADSKAKVEGRVGYSCCAGDGAPRIWLNLMVVKVGVRASRLQVRAA